ncbi:hypothetical protein Tco_0138467 [Tanacetum coccineum]
MSEVDLCRGIHLIQLVCRDLPLEVLRHSGYAVLEKKVRYAISNRSGYPVSVYRPEQYYKDDSWWSEDLKLKTTEDIINIESFVEVLRVLKYLKKTMDYSLTYIGYPLDLEGYTSASWISNSEDNSSTSGWVFLLGGGVISWASKKQTCITSSTMKSKFVALAAAGKKAE